MAWPMCLMAWPAFIIRSATSPKRSTICTNNLMIAQRIGDQRRVANAYNNLANVYFDSGDYDRAIETLRHNLQLARRIDYERIVCLSLLNLAQTYLLAGDGARALENGLHGLRVCQETGFELFEVYALDLIGKAYVNLGTPSQAIPYLEQALALSGRLESKVVEPLVLLSLGEAYRDMRQFDRAAECLHQAVAVAHSINARNELFQGHSLLSEIYQQQGDFASALHHFKEYHTWREKVFNEKADQRLKVLQVAHDTETSQREAEILRLRAQRLEREIIEQRKLDEALQVSHDALERQVKARTAELSDAVALLKQEIVERERAEAEIQHMVETLEQRVAVRTEELAAFFDLTLLAGQAVNLNDIFEQALPRIIEVTRSHAICIHLLDADRATLGLAAQQGLSAHDQARLQTVKPWPAFRRWLQQPNDPLASTALPGTMLLPPALRHLGFKTYLGAQIRIGQRVEGVLSYFRFTDQGYGVDEIALGTALAEQMGLVLEIDHLRANAEAVAVLEERQRLARDLHDSVTQSLYSLSLFSRAAREAAEDGDADRLNRSLTELERNTLHTLREMRLLLFELRPADLEREGLIRAIELRLNAVERRVGLQLEVQLDEFPDLPPNYEVQLYHIVVEALNNVVKHAAATRLTLRLTRTNGHLYLQIVDNGRGYDPTQTSGGMGLGNIRERLTRLNSEFAISSEPGGGTRLEAMIPYQAEEDR